MRRQSVSVGGGSAAQLLQQAPGVFLSQHAGQGKAPQLFLRGFDAEHGQDVEVSVFGVPINEPQNVHGHGYADVTFIPAELVRALVTSEGSFDPRHGDFAVAGAVDYRLGLSDPGVLVRASAGSFNLWRLFVGYRPDSALVDGERTFVAGELVRGDGFGAPSAAQGTPTNRAFSRASVTAGIGADVFGIDVSALAASSLSSYQSAGVLREEDALGSGGTVDDDAFFQTMQPGQGGEASRHLVAARARAAHDDGSTTLSLALTQRGLALRHNFTGALLYPDVKGGDTVAQTSTATAAHVGVEHARRAELFGATQRGAVGVELRGDRVHATQAREDESGVAHTREIDADVDLGHGAVYVDTALVLLPHTVLLAGARAEGVTFATVDHTDSDRARATAGLFVGPRASFQVQWTPEVTTSVAYGEGFRTPPALVLARGEVPPVTVARTAELGAGYARSSSSSSLQARARAFGVFVEQDRAFDHATATSLFIGPTLRLGVSAFVDVVTVVSGADVGVTASATAVSASRLIDDALSDPVPFSPPLTARLDTFVARPLGVSLFSAPVRGRVELGAGLVSPRPLLFGDVAPAVALIDGAVGVDIGIVGLALEAHNVTDARVRDGAFSYASRFDNDDSAVPARHLSAAAPRLMQLTLALRLP